MSALARSALLLVVALFAALAGEGRAALPEALQKIKPSVVAVGTYQRTRSPAFKFLGTGFVVGDGRQVATNAHVVPLALDAERLEQLAVAVPAADGRVQVRSAQLLAQAREHDLALLRIEGAALPALALAGDALAAEGSPVGLTGFPIGGALGLTPVTHRGIIAAVTPISIPQANARHLDAKVVRSLSDGPLLVYQLDATAYPGNSGSPLFDVESAAVIGIINMVFIKGTKENVIANPSGITYAIPVRHLRRLLE